MSNTQDPKLISDDPIHGKSYDHPAFGQIAASRVTGQASLYGSDFEHNAFVEITISRSELHRNLSRDWHHGTERLVSVRLSEAQWATFVSSLNIGSDVPCTLDRVAGKRAPSIPLEAEHKTASREVIERARSMGEKVTQTINAIESELGASISKKRREEILTHLKKLEQDLNHNVEFYVDSFDKHMESTVEKAKIEVGAYVQSTLQRAGLESLGAAPISLLQNPDDGCPEEDGEL
jgi:hypothetical protein